MHKLELTLACGRYDRTQRLIDGRVEPEGVKLTFLPLRPGETFWRMLNHGEFDASEMSLSSYSILRSEGDTRFTAIPVFPSRVFRHSAVYVRTDSGVERPEDLKGGRVGVGDYQMTAAVWVRGFLLHEHGVAPEEIEAAIDTSAATLGIDTIIIGGGDGTQSLAATKLAGKEIALGVLPFGTVNLLGRDLGIPLAIEEAVKALAGAEPVAIDLAEVNGRLFHSLLGLGFFARMASERQRARHQFPFARSIAFRAAPR